MKYIGIFIIVAAIFGFGIDYQKKEKEKLSQCEGFLSLISHIRVQTSCYLSPLCNLLTGFECRALENVGLLTEFRNCSNLLESYKKVEKNLLLDKEEKHILFILFSSLGQAYIEDTMKLIDSSEHALSERADEMRQKVDKNSKISGVLSCAIALGLLIFLI